MPYGYMNESSAYKEYIKYVCITMTNYLLSLSVHISKYVFNVFSVGITL